ncbi:MAG: glycosyltransferase [Spirochaetaceae bacterium]|nr:glycosyltransferase [Spirochaetaceae bacterium]
MKCIYIYSSNDKDYKSNGESKKVLSQIGAFEDFGINVKLLDCILDKKIHKLLYRLPVFGVYPSKFIKKCEKEVLDCDFVYIRKNIFDKSYLKLLKSLRKVKPTIKIFVEIPTFPYFQEWNRFIDKPLIFKEKKNIPRVTKEKLVDYYMTLTSDTEIFGIPTIQFENCVTLKDYKIKENLQATDEIHMVGVALVASWHGYDRIIRGLKEYYNGNNKMKVYFHIVGEGPEIKNLKKMVLDYNISSYVIFEGKQFGEKLDYLYNKAHIAIGSLAPYRKGIYSGNSLKTREYCSKGIPFVMAKGEPLFDNYEYTYVVPNDDSIINIQEICKYVYKIDYSNVSLKMREYAKEHLDWKTFVESILEKVD